MVEFSTKNRDKGNWYNLQYLRETFELRHDSTKM